MVYETAETGTSVPSEGAINLKTSVEATKTKTPLTTETQRKHEN
jgi:hypothetical protein